ncbi:MAG: sigma-70 family RNA polymerase sigma factor [Deltaproteobacteria bacterium]|nr:sigma-70 family RNA polymerase sigma factor [Deltaproteobacteria bacterium]
MPVSSPLPVTFGDIAPLLRGTFEGREGLAAFVRRYRDELVRFASSQAQAHDDPRSFAGEVLSQFIVKVQAKDGLPPPREPRADYWGWLALTIVRTARDLNRKSRRHDEKQSELDDASDPRPESLERPPSPEDEVVRAIEQRARSERAKQALAVIQDPSFPPNYRLALIAWHWFSLIRQDHLETVANQPNRGRAGTVTGLARPVAEAWPLARGLSLRLPEGIADRGDAQDEFAWIVRATHALFSAWLEDTRAVRSARETIGKWHQRGRAELEQRMPPTRGEAK